MDKENLSAYIDHTLLKPSATEEQIAVLCAEAITFNFATVCVNPFWVRKATEKLEGSNVKTCAAIAFPLGATPTDVKLYEAKQCLSDGAEEIDMVINLGLLKNADWSMVEKDIAVLAEAAHAESAILKVILETCYLDRDEIVKACRASLIANADFVKTSTGFGSGGATIEDVKLMADTVAGDCGVKASGGIRDYETAIQMIDAGAIRLGTSSGVAIVTNEPSESI